MGAWRDAPGDGGRVLACGADASLRPDWCVAARLSRDLTPCKRFVAGIDVSSSSARGALGAVGGGLALRTFGAARGALGAVGAFAGGASLSSTMTFGPS